MKFLNALVLIVSVSMFLLCGCSGRTLPTPLSNSSTSSNKPKLDSFKPEQELYEDEEGINAVGEMDSWERLEIGLPILGRIHTILGDVEVGTDARRPLFANHIEAHDALNRTLRGTHTPQRTRSPTNSS